MELKIGSDDAQWFEVFRLRRLHGDELSAEEIEEEKLANGVDAKDFQYSRKFGRDYPSDEPHIECARLN